MGLFDGTDWEREIRCERCQQLATDCDCPPIEEAPEPHVAPEKQRLRIAVEKRRKGKKVTAIHGLEGPDSQRKELLTTLKTACGSGGTDKDGVLEIQGDHVEVVREHLRGLGYRS
jgi:translation initiation factor 1